MTTTQPATEDKTLSQILSGHIAGSDLDALGDLVQDLEYYFESELTRHVQHLHPRAVSASVDWYLQNSPPEDDEPLVFFLERYISLLRRGMEPSEYQLRELIQLIPGYVGDVSMPPISYNLCLVFMYTLGYYPQVNLERVLDEADTGDNGYDLAMEQLADVVNLQNPHSERASARLVATRQPAKLPNFKSVRARVLALALEGARSEKIYFAGPALMELVGLACSEGLLGEESGHDLHLLLTNHDDAPEYYEMVRPLIEQYLSDEPELDEDEDDEPEEDGDDQDDSQE